MNADNVGRLIDRYREKDRLALARLLTLAGHPETSAAVSAALRASRLPSRKARVAAVTGSGGVGKSTLIGRLIELLRASGTTVAVLACDPQSPITGGALLGDRIRMPARPADDGVFIRSVAAAGGGQGVADNIDLMIQLLSGFGFEFVLLETTGAGQGDTAVRNIADVVVVLVQPEAGDELQWEKAGVMEIADVVAVNKSDLPGAERVEAQLHNMLHMPGGRSLTIVRLSGGRNEGVEAIWKAVESLVGKDRTIGVTESR